MLTDRPRRKSTSEKNKTKIQITAWYRILGLEILNYEEFQCKTTEISEENGSHQAK